jgi:hypothetical protein
MRPAVAAQSPPAQGGIMTQPSEKEKMLSSMIRRLAE